MLVNALCVCSVYRGQKRSSDALGLEFLAGVKNHVGSGNQNSVLCKNMLPSKQSP